jgi:hypothetical protein
MIAATNCSKQQAQEFVEWLNTLNPNLKFTFEWSDESISYLDVKLVMEGGKLEPDRHVKPTNLQLFLHFSSNPTKSVLSPYYMAKLSQCGPCAQKMSSCSAIWKY